MGEGLVTGRRVSLELHRPDPPVRTQHGNSAKLVEGSKNARAFELSRPRGGRYAWAR